MPSSMFFLKIFSEKLQINLKIFHNIAVFDLIMQTVIWDQKQ